MSSFPTHSSPCFVVAEVAQSHDGSLGMAHAFIDAVAKTGAHAIKFQTHIAAAESTRHESWRVKFSKQDASRYDYWKRMEFTEAQWRGLAEHASECGLLFVSSPFSLEAVELLSKLEMPFWKIPSGEINNFDLLARILKNKKPVVLSTGMCTYEELDRAVSMVRKESVPFSTLQCTTEYPCPPEKVGLNILEELRKRYDCPVGLSDHSASIFPGLAAATLSAKMIEVHVALSRDMFGPDVPASLTISELKQLVEGVSFIEKMLSNPVNKNEAAAGQSQMRRVFMKKIVARAPLSSGTKLKSEHLSYKKADQGLLMDQTELVLGKTLVCSLEADQPILPEHFTEKSL